MSHRLLSNMQFAAVPERPLEQSMASPPHPDDAVEKEDARGGQTVDAEIEQ